MKIAIVANGFTGATLPLAKHLHDAHFDVDCFYMVPYGNSEIESLNYNQKMLRNRPSLLPKKNRIYKYLSTDSNIYLLPINSIHRRQKFLLYGILLLLVNYYRLLRLKHMIRQGKYNIVYIVVHTKYEVSLLKSLLKQQQKVIADFHEVLNSHFSDATLKQEVVNTIKYPIQIIVHSQKTYNDLIQNASSDVSAKTHIIPFGPFESYNVYDVGVKNIEFKENYYLYVGHIAPYKGLSVLYDVFKDESSRFLVVAGKGKDPVLKKMQNCKNIELINRYIGNEELVSLIAHCRAVICPYLSASQSGIVQTAIVLKKAVIASKVGAFPEIINDKKNGMLIEPGNINSLRTALKVFEQLDIREISLEGFPSQYEWKNIINLYQGVIEHE